MAIFAITHLSFGQFKMFLQQVHRLGRDFITIAFVVLTWINRSINIVIIFMGVSMTVGNTITIGLHLKCLLYHFRVPRQCNNKGEQQSKAVK